MKFCFSFRKFKSSILYRFFRKYFRLIKSRRMRWAGHIVCMGEMKNA
jgi:hypothetical protein